MNDGQLLFKYTFDIVNSLQIRLFLAVCQHSSMMWMLHLRPEGMEKNTSHIKDSIYM